MTQCKNNGDTKLYQVGPECLSASLHKMHAYLIKSCKTTSKYLFYPEEHLCFCIINVLNAAHSQSADENHSCRCRSYGRCYTPKDLILHEGTCAGNTCLFLQKESYNGCIGRSYPETHSKPKYHSKLECPLVC